MKSDLPARNRSILLYHRRPTDHTNDVGYELTPFEPGSGVYQNRILI